MDRVCALYIGWREGVRGENTLFFVCSQFSHNTDSQCSLHTILMLNSQNTDAQFSIIKILMLNSQLSHTTESVLLMLNPQFSQY